MSHHHHHGRHKVKAHKWQNGVLNVAEYIFESFEDAVAWCMGADSDSYKIYDENSELVYSGDITDVETYA